MTSFGFPADYVNVPATNEFSMYNDQTVATRKQKEDNLFFDSMPAALSPEPYTRQAGFDDNTKSYTKYRVECFARAPLPKFSTT
jgi:hypothetical protein